MKRVSVTQRFIWANSLSEKEFIEMLSACRLSDLERGVVKARMQGSEGTLVSLKEIAKDIGFTAGYARDIEVSTIHKIRRYAQCELKRDLLMD